MTNEQEQYIESLNTGWDITVNNPTPGQDWSFSIDREEILSLKRCSGCKGLIVVGSNHICQGTPEQAYDRAMGVVGRKS